MPKKIAAAPAKDASTKKASRKSVQPSAREKATAPAHPGKSLAPMKRPAAAAPCSSQAPEESRNKKRKSIAAALQGVDELSPKLRNMLGCLTDLALEPQTTELSSFQSAAMAMVREGLASVERKLQQEVGKAQQSLELICLEKELRETEVSSAMSREAELKKSLAGSRLEVKESMKAIDTSTDGLHTIKDLQKLSQAKLEEAASKVDKLRDLDENLYQPLKMAPPPGAEGRKQLKKICKVGKDLGLQGRLLQDVPTVLKKELDKRRTFDGLVIEQMDSELSKRYEKLQDTLREEQAAFHEHAGAAQAAEAILQDSVQARNSQTKAVTEAQAALSECKAQLLKQRQAAKKMQKALEDAVQNLANVEGRLEAFRNGPLAAFAELQQTVPATEAAQASTSAASSSGAGVVSVGAAAGTSIAKLMTMDVDEAQEGALDASYSQATPCTQRILVSSEQQPTSSDATVAEDGAPFPMDEEPVDAAPLPAPSAPVAAAPSPALAPLASVLCTGSVDLAAPTVPWMPGAEPASSSSTTAVMLPPAHPAERTCSSKVQRPEEADTLAWAPTLMD